MSDINLQSPSNSIDCDWAEHPLRNATATATGMSFSVSNVPGICGWLATIATPLVSLYDSFVQGLFSKINNLFSDVTTPVLTAVDNFSLKAETMLDDTGVFDCISYALALDGVASLFSGVFLDSLVLVGSFIGSFIAVYISFCIATVLYRLTCRIIKIISLGWIHTC